MEQETEKQLARVFDANLPEFADRGQVNCSYNDYSEVLAVLRAKGCFVYTVHVQRGGYLLDFDKPRLRQPGLL